jgi:hypothetical protein
MIIKFAEVESGLVVKVGFDEIEAIDGTDYIECPREVDVGWTYDGTNFIPCEQDVDAERAALRQQRNELLSESDWTQTLDAPVNRQAWAEYRQKLRDITKVRGFPFNVVFPTKPQEQ